MTPSVIKHTEGAPSLYPVSVGKCCVPAFADVVLQETGSGFSIDNWSRQIAVACLEADLGPQHMGYGARVLPFCKEAAQDA